MATAFQLYFLTGQPARQTPVAISFGVPIPHTAAFLSGSKASACAIRRRRPWPVQSGLHLRHTESAIRQFSVECVSSSEPQQHDDPAPSVPSSSSTLPAHESDTDHSSTATHINQPAGPLDKQFDRTSHSPEKTDWRALSRVGREVVSRAIANARRSRIPLGDALRVAAEQEKTNPFVWHAAAMHHTRARSRHVEPVDDCVQEQKHLKVEQSGDHQKTQAKNDLMIDDSELVDSLFGQRETRRVAPEGPVIDFDGASIDAARNVLEAALKVVPHGRRAGLFLAMGKLAPQASQEAIAAFHAGIDDDPQHVPLYTALAAEFVRQGNINKARNVFQNAENNVSGHSLAHLVRAKACFEESIGEHDRAREHWEFLTKIRPKDPRAWKNFAISARSAGAKPRDVANILHQAVSLHPHSSDLRVSLAKILERLQGPASARACLEHPAMRDNQYALRALAMLEFRERNCDKARHIFRRAADLENRWTSGYIFQSYTPAEGVENATDSFPEGAGTDQSLLASGDQRDFHQGLAPKNGQHRSSGGDRRKIARTEPTVRSLHSWALMESKLGNYDNARSLLHEAQTIRQDDSAIWRALAEVESRAKNYGAARNAFQKAVAVGGADSRLWLAWGRSEAHAGYPEKSEEYLQMAVRLLKPQIYPILQHKSSQDTSDRLNGDVADILDSDESRPSHNARSPVFVEDGQLHETSMLAADIPVRRVLAEAMRELANIAASSGRLEEAMAYLQDGTKADPTYELGWRQLAELLRRQQGMEAVRSMYKSALTAVGGHVHAKLYHWWALDERQGGLTDNARSLLRRATIAEPKYMSAWLSWALLEKAEGDAETACKLFEEAANLASRSSLRAPYIFQVWGKVEETTCHDVDRARSIFRRGHQLIPESGLILQAWAALEERCGEIETARDLLRKATIAEPRIGFIWQSWGLLESRRRRYEEASKLFERGHENDPANAAVLSSWATIEGRDLGNTAKARTLFERALRVDPQHASSWHSWASLELLLGNVERARDLYLRAAKVGPEDPVNWHALGCLESEHALSDSLPISYFRRALEADPTHGISYQSWALFIERKMQDLSEARRIFELGVQNCAPGGKAVVYQAWSLMEQRHGNVAVARDLMQIGLEVDRTKVELWMAWALLEKSLGNHKTARRLFQDATTAVAPVQHKAAIYSAWGSFEAEHGDLEEARRLFNLGIRINPRHHACWRAFATMEDRLGNKAKAEELRLAASGLLSEDYENVCG